MSRTCPASWLGDHSALMTSPQYDIAMGSGTIDHCRYFLLRSLYIPCASAHPAKDFFSRSTAKLAGRKGPRAGRCLRFLHQVTHRTMVIVIPNAVIGILRSGQFIQVTQ